jgi:hypothetical protein
MKKIGKILQKKVSKRYLFPPLSNVQNTRGSGGIYTLSEKVDC